MSPHANELDRLRAEGDTPKLQRLARIREEIRQDAEGYARDKMAITARRLVRDLRSDGGR